MGQGYYDNNMHENEAGFSLFFRKSPFEGGYAVLAGLETVIDFIENYSFDQSDIDYLATLTGKNGKPLFTSNYLKYLNKLKFSCTVEGIPEGTVVFPFLPLLKVTGPLIQCQLLESVLLNIINFQTLIATKASRMLRASQGEPILEFGLRRAQGYDGALSASRASYIEGCSSTSNTLAGKLYGIPVKGTHAHSWVMSFDNEIESFRKYAASMPNNCIFLVDTLDN